MCTFLRNDLLEVYYCAAAIILQNFKKKKKKIDGPDLISYLSLL